MNLSPEDSLRLNVLLTQDLQAVRIDESKMTVFALTLKGEATVPLNPNCRDDQYLKRVRELLSTQVLGSPGGYPVYLKRWTRMGQERENDSLHSLLKLGEPEAVVAVVHAPGLSPELASLAWWAMPEAENARCMLASTQVAEAEIGRELAAFLIEYLPFETEPEAIFSSVRLVLQPGLVDDSVRQKLWQRAARKGSFYVGFLQAVPDDLPETAAAHPDYAAVSSALAPLLLNGKEQNGKERNNSGQNGVADNNPIAKLLCRVMSPAGQAFLKTVNNAMEKLADEAAAVALFDVIGRYFRAVLPVGQPGAAQAGKNSETAVAFAQASQENIHQFSPAMAEVLAVLPEQRASLSAMVALSFAGEALLDSFFSHSDAVGSLMRRKMKPWIEPMLAQIKRLQT